MRKIGYCRTSTTDQVAGIEKQAKDLEAYGCSVVFKEHVSAVNDSRPEFEKALSELKAGDTLVVTTMSRLCRRTADLGTIQQALEERGAGLEILDLRIDTSTAIGRMTLSIIAAVSQMERELMLERQAVGIAKAKTEGKYQGRKATATTLKNAADLQVHLRRGLSISEAAKLLGISRASAYRIASVPS